MEIAGYGWNTGSGYRIIPESSSLTKISVSGQEIMGFNRVTHVKSLPSGIPLRGPPLEDSTGQSVFNRGS
jgi:hypothetical protein